MPGTRTRTRQSDEPDGDINVRDSSGAIVDHITKLPFKHENSSCGDVVGSWDTVNFFNLDKKEWTHSEPLNGSAPTFGSNTVEYNNWVARAYTVFPGDVAIAVPSDNASIQQAAARSNPGRVGVHLPVFLAELRDIPHLIKSGGDLLTQFWRLGRTPSARSQYLSSLGAARNGAGIYLNYQFGVQPLISDIRKMLMFTELVDRRVGDLQRLYSSGGLHKKITVFSDVQTISGVDIVNSDWSVVFQARKTITTQKKKWVVLHWRPTAYPSFRHGTNMRYLARRLVTGTSGFGHQQMTELWEALPWSWFIDWFANVGQWMQAHSNAVPVQMDRCSVMSSTETTGTWSRISGPSTVSGGSSSYRHVNKLRSSGALSPTPLGEIPFLNSAQYSVLASLAMLGRNRPRVVN